VLKDPAAEVETPLSSRRALVGVLRGAQRAGAAVIVHGLTHQYTGRTGEDAEFWDMSRNRPPVSRSQSDTAHRMGEAIAELARCGLYPLVWATPKGRASSANYAEIARSCSTVCERRLPSALAPAPQVFPFVIERDSYGQRVIPDNLSPMRRGTADVESILEQVRCQSVVPDPWLTVTVAPDSPPDAVRVLVAGLKELGFEFADLRRTSNWMKGRALEIRSEESAKPVADLLPAGWDATVLGPGKGDLRRFEEAATDDRENGLVRPGAILVAYPPGGRPREVFAFEGGPDELARRLVSGVARVAVIFAVAVCVVFVLIYLSQVSLQRRT
jgi:hypothetical protein